MKHVALTNAPWIDGLEPFGGLLAASIYTEDADELDLDLLADLPDLLLGWMPSNVKESQLDDGDFAVVYKDGDKKVRKLPYKIHGQVNEAGWKAAWNMAAKVSGAGGMSLKDIRAKLLRSKPKGVQVDDSLKTSTVLLPDLMLASKPTHLDPETAKHGGSILNIVKSAHKWGGNGTEPKFEKIKRVLLAKHPEVIAKAFGGDPNKAAAWIKDQWWSIFRPGTQWRSGGKKKATNLSRSTTLLHVTKGGATHMADENGEGTEVLELTQDDLDRMIQEKVNAEREEMALRLSKQDAELRAMRVERKIADLQKQGHAPAVLKEAKRIYLADEGYVMLSLAKEEGDGTDELTASDAVDRVLAALPTTALNLSNVEPETGSDDPDEKKDSVEAKAKQAWDELHADPE